MKFIFKFFSHKFYDNFQRTFKNFPRKVEFLLIKILIKKVQKKSSIVCKEIIKRSLKNLKKQTVNPTTTDEMFHEMYICICSKEGLYFISSGLNWT